jgi:hypothetical protein
MAGAGLAAAETCLLYFGYPLWRASGHGFQGIVEIIPQGQARAALAWFSAQGLAEAQGFEPWNPCGLPVFKTGAIDHSAKLPVGAPLWQNFNAAPWPAGSRR